MQRRFVIMHHIVCLALVLLFYDMLWDARLEYDI